MYRFFIPFYSWIFRWIDRQYFVHVLLSWWTFGLFPHLAIPHLINNVGMKICVQVFVWTYFHLSGIYLGVKLLGYVYNFLRNCRCIFKVAYHFTFLQAMDEHSSVSAFWSTLLLSVFFIIVILVGVQWYLIGISICISLMNNDVERFFICMLPFVYLGRTIYSDPLSIF